MPTFPRTELETLDLARAMSSGITDHPADFPSVTPAELTDALTAYDAALTSQHNALAQARVATGVKEQALAALAEQMKLDLKRCQVDTADQPTRLTEIGWGPRARPQSLTAPNPPSSLRTAAGAVFRSISVVSRRRNRTIRTARDR